MLRETSAKVKRLSTPGDVDLESRTKALNKLTALVSFPKELFYEKLCSASDFPQRQSDYYERALSILRKLVENPAGIHTIQKWYSRPIRSTVKRGTKFLYARKPPIRMILNSLVDKGLVKIHMIGDKKSGYVTTLIGKKIL